MKSIHYRNKGKILSMALQLILHTFRMIFGNLEQALRVSVVPTIILWLGEQMISIVLIQTPGFMSFLVQLSALAIVLLSFFVSAWIAVSWHRFVLLEEYPGILPAISGRPIWPYFGKSLLMLLILFLIGGVFVASFYIVLLIPIGSGSRDVGLWVNYLSMFCAFIALTVLIVASLRMGSALVATALEKPMTFRASVDSTRSIRGVIWRVVFIMLVAAVPLNFVASYLASTNPLVGAIVGVASGWLGTMFGASLLTTIYGHVVEGRPLVTE